MNIMVLISMVIAAAVLLGTVAFIAWLFGYNAGVSDMAKARVDRKAGDPEESEANHLAPGHGLTGGFYGGLE